MPAQILAGETDVKFKKERKAPSSFTEAVIRKPQKCYLSTSMSSDRGCPGGAVVKNPPTNAGDAGDVGLIPGSGRSPGVENGNPLQYSSLENSMDRWAWWATVRGVTQESDMCECILCSVVWQEWHAEHQIISWVDFPLVDFPFLGWDDICVDKASSVQLCRKSCAQPTCCCHPWTGLLASGSLVSVWELRF